MIQLSGNHNATVIGPVKNANSIVTTLLKHFLELLLTSKKHSGVSLAAQFFQQIAICWLEHFYSLQECEIKRVA